MAHKPPSYYRWKQNHKTITLNFTLDEYHDMENLTVDSKQLKEMMLKLAREQDFNVDSLKDNEIQTLKAQIEKYKKSNQALLKQLES